MVIFYSYVNVYQRLIIYIIVLLLKVPYTPIHGLQIYCTMLDTMSAMSEGLHAWNLTNSMQGMKKCMQHSYSIQLCIYIHTYILYTVSIYCVYNIYIYTDIYIYIHH